MPAQGCFESLCVEVLWAGWVRSVCIVGISKRLLLNKAFKGGEETRAPVNICKTNCREIITLVSQSHVCRLATVMPKDGKRGVNPVWASAQNLLLVYIDKTQWQRRCMVQVLQQDEPVEDMTTHA